MAQPAVRQDQLPATDADSEQQDGSATGPVPAPVPEPASASDSTAANEAETQTRQAPALKVADNPVRRVIEELRTLSDEMDDLREHLRAHGVPLSTTRMLVELGIQKNPKKQAQAIVGAVNQAEKSFGKGCIDRPTLENHISTIVNLERELSHARASARDDGLDAKALSTLTQMVQQNPGDNGAKAVNTFLGYAMAYGIRTDQLADIVGELTTQTTSVLPQIPRQHKQTDGVPARRVALDALIGLIIGLAVIWVML